MNEKSQFDELLKWLNADRDQAALAYENIRSRLIGIFARKGAEFPEELADETIQRVTKRVAEIGPNYEGDPAYYFVGVARLVFLESVNKKSTPMAPVEPPAVDQVEREHQCLQSCLKQIPDPRQRIILDYYRGHSGKKIENRARLAEKLGIGLNALRLRVLRIRNGLRQCVNRCLESAATM